VSLEGEQTIDTVKQILKNKGVESPEDMEINENYTIESDGYEDLTIEKLADNRISVAQTYTQRMDLMRDPEIVYEIEETGDWKPVEYQQDPGIYQHDENGLNMDGFVEQWDENLKKQGFVEASKQ
jgi:hypothetical protein